MTIPETRITAAICTYNRVDYVEDAIRSLLNQTYPVELTDIIVVDNASTDNTREIVESLQKKSSHGHRFRYFLEKNQGLSYARNRALDECTTDYIAFLDDDAKASEQWLEYVVRSFIEPDPSPAIVGGKIDLYFEGEKPDWADEFMHGQYLPCVWSGLDFGDQPRFMQPNEGAVGANIAYSVKVLKSKGIQFPVDLGRIGNNLLGGEEGDVSRKLVAAGFRSYYHPTRQGGPPGTRIPIKGLLCEEENLLGREDARPEHIER